MNNYPNRQRFRLDVDALTNGDAEYNSIRYIDAYDVDEAIDAIRADFELYGERVFRIRYNNEVIWQAKGQE